MTCDSAMGSIEIVMMARLALSLASFDTSFKDQNLGTKHIPGYPFDSVVLDITVKLMMSLQTAKSQTSMTSFVIPNIHESRNSLYPLLYIPQISHQQSWKGSRAVLRAAQILSRSGGLLGIGCQCSGVCGEQILDPRRERSDSL